MANSTPGSNPPINGAAPGPESSQVGSSKPRPKPPCGACGPRNPKQGGL